MSLSQKIDDTSQSEQTSEEQPASTRRCPVDHQSFAHQKMVHRTVVNASETPLTRDEQGIWHIYGFDEARTVLRSSATRQAGFNAEQIASVPGTTNQPILYLEGQEHHQQRKQTARFFTPKTVSTRYRQFIEQLTGALIDELKRKKRADLSKLSLKMAVQVAARVVGTTNSIAPGMAMRLETFFEGGKQTEEKHLLGTLLARLYRPFQQSNVMLFFLLDVRPAIRARRRRPQEDVISHLLSLHRNDAEILTECMTYAAAGMVTTREFISVAAWHLLEHPDLRWRYLNAPEEERIEMLHETLRLEPIVRLLQRRATSDISLQSQGQSFVIHEGDLINIHIDAANMDERVVGEDPELLCPARPIHGSNIPSMLMSFGDGHHRCPGAYIAIQETDIFLHHLLSLDTLHIERKPTVMWNDLTTGYEVRDFIVAL